MDDAGYLSGCRKIAFTLNLNYSFFFFFFFFFVVLGFELRAYTFSHLPALFCDGFFWIGSCRLFPQAGF
jgi:hypothetical protein